MTGNLYLDKYIFTDKPLNSALITNMSLEQINNMLDKDRSNMGKKPIMLVSVKNNSVLEFDSIKNCLKYLNTMGPANKTTLYRRVESGSPYNGFICKWKN